MITLVHLCFTYCTAGVFVEGRGVVRRAVLARAHRAAVPAVLLLLQTITAMLRLMLQTNMMSNQRPMLETVCTRLCTVD